MLLHFNLSLNLNKQTNACEQPQSVWKLLPKVSEFSFLTACIQVVITDI